MLQVQLIFKYKTFFYSFIRGGIITPSFHLDIIYFKNILFRFLFFVLIYGANAQEIEFSNESFKNGTITNCELLKEQEFLEYNIKVGLISVGEINFRKYNCKNSNLTHAEIKGYTKGISKLFFNLIVNYKSSFLKKKFTPIKFIKSIIEGDEQKLEEIYFNDNLKKAYYQNKGDDKGRFFIYEKELFDLVSGIYFFRSNMDVIFKDSSLFNMPYLHNGSGIKNLKIELIGDDKIKISNVFLKSKKFSCVFESTNKLLPKKGEIYFWISDDQYNLPLCFETKLRLSNVKIELKNLSDHLDLK